MQRLFSNQLCKTHPVISKSLTSQNRLRTKGKCCRPCAIIGFGELGQKHCYSAAATPTTLVNLDQQARAEGSIAGFTTAAVFVCECV